MITADTATMAPGQLNRYRGAFRSAGAPRRWIGRCRCGAGIRVEGEPLYDAKGDAAALGADGMLYTTRVLNTHELVLVLHGCGSWVFCRSVFDGGKPASKRHACGSRCTGATGPACDCRCRGANHGSGAMSDAYKPFAVNLWGSHPDAGNDDCWTGDEFETLAEALACYRQIAGTAEHQLCKVTGYDWEFVQIDGPGVHDVSPNPDQATQRRKRRELAAGGDDWRHERAIQAGMAFGCDGYNDEMGY